MELSQNSLQHAVESQLVSVIAAEAAHGHHRQVGLNFVMINFIPSLSSTTAALDAERTRLEVIAQNIANANTTRGLDGRPYQRQQVVFETALQRAQASDGSSRIAAAAAGQPHSKGFAARRRRFTSPGHPDADANGMVQLPNVNIYEEMADMIVASRTYDANVAVFKNGRAMAMQALSIGKH